MLKSRAKQVQNASATHNKHLILFNNQGQAIRACHRVFFELSGYSKFLLKHLKSSVPPAYNPIKTHADTRDFPKTTKAA